MLAKFDEDLTEDNKVWGGGGGGLKAPRPFFIKKPTRNKAED